MGNAEIMESQTQIITEQKQLENDEQVRDEPPSYSSLSQMNDNYNKQGISYPSLAKPQIQPRPVPLVSNNNDDNDNNSRAGNLIHDDMEEIVRYHQTMIRCITNKDKNIELDINMIDSELFAKVIHCLNDVISSISSKCIRFSNDSTLYEIGSNYK